MSQVVSACLYLGQSPLGPQIAFSCLPSWPHIQSSPAQRHLLEGLGARSHPSGRYTLNFGGSSPLLPPGAQAETPGSLWS